MGSLFCVEYEPAKQLLDELCGNGRRERSYIAHGIEFDDVGADQPPLEAVDDVDDLARRKSPGFMMRHARCECRVQTVEIHGDIDRPFERERDIISPVPHLDDLHPELARLLFLMRVERSDADLDQPMDDAILHQSGKRRGVGIGIVLEV